MSQNGFKDGLGIVLNDSDWSFEQPNYRASTIHHLLGFHQSMVYNEVI